VFSGVLCLQLRDEFQFFCLAELIEIMTIIMPSVVKPDNEVQLRLIPVQWLRATVTLRMH
jgi:hypothetical protein